eukprot:TRINITY_DN1667_c0_g1_i2.p1 TRINITY_DN1667_c0_g1~~TRINITY_DN1667_c0_g1_i2.p1  ORF type:complete len:304 (+),score=72.32 TRINITY_DN1667_c0_g1_i2:132-1043(+)
MDSALGAMYGAALPPPRESMTKRRRMNPMGVNLSFLLPWLLFCVVCATRSFSIRFTMPVLANLVVFAAFVLVVAISVLAVRAVYRQGLDGSLREPMWYIFLALTSLLAFGLALSFGEWNWRNYGSLYYGMGHLNDYSSVDPSKMRGQQLMDAGSVQFIKSAGIEQRLAMAFKNQETYCVAPITTGGASQTSYDFWAVGLDCCSGAGNFNCGAAKDSTAHAGLRWMQEEQAGFYKLAVQQAQAMYKIRADYPLFFRWVRDPVGEQDGWLGDARQSYYLCVAGHFFLQLLLVFCAVIFFAKLGAN